MPNFENSKLIAGYITMLKPEDFKELVKFLKSPYHNSTKILVPFLRAIQQRYPDFAHKNFTQENIYKKLYPKRQYNDKVFQGLTGELIKKIDAYRAHEQLSKNENLKKELVNKYLASKNQYTKFRDNSMKEIEKLKGKENKSLQDFGQLLSLIHDLFFHPETPRDSKWANTYITTCMDILDCLYFFLKTTYGIELLTRNNLQDQKHEIKLLDEAIQLGRQTILNKNVLFNLYVLFIEFLKSKDEKTYKKLENYLFEKHAKITTEGQVNASIVMANYVFQKYLEEGIDHLQELVAMHKFRDKQNLLLENNRISNERFINVINTTAAYGEFEWAISFQDRYTQYLKEDSREDVLCYCRACIQFHKGVYVDAIAELKDIESKSLYINLRFRSLSIRTYYELSLIHDSYQEETEKSIRRFIAYLPDKNIHEDRKHAYNNFCQVCLALLYGKKEKALKKIKEAKKLMFRHWLLKKVEQLK